MWVVVLAGLILLTLPAVSTTQFATPLPKPLTAVAVESQEIFADPLVKEELTEAINNCTHFGGIKKAEQLCRTSKDRVKGLRDEISRHCEGTYSGDTASIGRCQRLVDADSILRGAITGVSTHSWPVVHGRKGLEELYKSVGDLSVLSKFAANLRDDQILVLSDVVSGAIGAFPFAVSVAAVATKNDTAIVSTRTSVLDTIGGIRGNLTRLINNGGSLSARVLAPIFVSRGPNATFGASVYFEPGLLGPLGREDSLKASAAMVVEGIFDFAIRRPDVSATQVADLFIGVRLGNAWSESSLAPGAVDRHSFRFLQFGFGLRTADRFGLSALLSTPVGASDVRKFVPKLTLNLSAVRF